MLTNGGITTSLLVVVTVAVVAIEYAILVTEPFNAAADVRFS